MDAWVRGKNKAFYEEEELHAQFLAEWEALYPSKDSMYTLVSPDRTGKEFRELRDELDKHGMDYKVVSEIPRFEQ